MLEAQFIFIPAEVEKDTESHTDLRKAHVDFEPTAEHQGHGFCLLQTP